MMIIVCPYCGARDEHEFQYGGEAHIARPTDGDKLTDDEWAEYLFLRTNTKGVFTERWFHRDGCRKWFNIARDTVTSEVVKVYPMGQPRPDLPASS